MQREMPNRETNPRNPQHQPERRRDDRRRQEQQPDEERRRQQRRENVQMTEGRPRQQSVPSEKQEQRGEGTARYSNPPSGKEFGPGGQEMGFGPKKSERRGAEARENFGESYDRGLGRRRESHEGAGGKTDSTQRDMGQTGQSK